VTPGNGKGSIDSSVARSEPHLPAQATDVKRSVVQRLIARIRSL
jgi:hypothetical protein